MTLRLFLVRHGESEWNQCCRYAGRQDVPLSERGRDQARRVAERLALEQLDAVYASTLGRARETAAIIAEARQMPLVLDTGLEEIHHGAWEGLTPRQVAQRFPAEYALWQSRPHEAVMPDGESLLQVKNRVEASLARMDVKQRDGAVLICAHDAVLRVIVLQCLELGMQHFWKLSFENASLSQLERQDQYGIWRLTSLNETSHLLGICSDYTLQAL